MIKILSILIVVITLVFVSALCKAAKRAEKNAEIIFEKYLVKMKEADDLNRL
jgi:hypothetical protein